MASAVSCTAISEHFNDTGLHAIAASQASRVLIFHYLFLPLPSGDIVFSSSGAFSTHWAYIVTLLEAHEFLINLCFYQNIRRVNNDPPEILKISRHIYFSVTYPMMTGWHQSCSRSFMY